MQAYGAPVRWLSAASRRSRYFLLYPLILLLVACASRPVDDGLDAGIDRVQAELIRLEGRGFVGQVAVAHAGEVLLLEGYGKMGVDRPEPVTAQAVMPLASLSKPFTASAILALAADGHLALSDPVGQHLKDLDGDWARVPIENLLTHTAGLPAEIHNRNWSGDPRFEPIDRAELIRRVNQFQPDHPPGDAYNYSNITYALLAAVIETISGKPFEVYLQERLLGPAGVEDVGLLKPGWTARDLVRGRHRGEDRGHYLDRPRQAEGLGFNLRGAGDLLARPAGIVAWYRAIRDDRWLASPWQDRWLTPQVSEPDGTRYGYGLHFRDGPWGPVVGHRGGDRVFATDFSWFTDPDVMVYIASASARFEADVLAPRVHRILLGH